MSLQDFASTVDDVFDRFKIVKNPVSGCEQPLDELFTDPVIVIHWSATSQKEIPDISPILNLAAREDMALVDRTLEYTESNESSTETPELSETLEFEYRP